MSDRMKTHESAVSFVSSETLSKILPNPACGYNAIVVLRGKGETTYLTTSSMTLASDSLSFLLRSFLFFAALGSSGRREEGRTPFLIEL